MNRFARGLLITSELSISVRVWNQNCQKNKHFQCLVCLDTHIEFNFDDSNSQETDVVDYYVFHSFCQHCLYDYALDGNCGSC